MEPSTRLWEAPDPTDAPATAAGLGTQPATPVVVRGMRRGIATALLAGGLLIVGGVAAVSAADPSASPAPNATQEPAAPGGTNPGHRGNCPNDGSNGGSDGSGGSNSSPGASPDASDSDV
ncbi:MAG TPA: hypothetical protein VFV72_05170 [Candidatus Limnocylindrales bacterium]|nr:hypothetical protein [Candidatus Limnocylindrales bacterium]